MTKIVFMPASAAGQSHRTRQEGGKMVAEADDPPVLVVFVVMVGPAALVAPSGGVGQHGDVARGAVHAFRRHPDGLAGGSRGALRRARLALALAAPGLASGLC
jgi:hypothetical protein